MNGKAWDATMAERWAVRKRATPHWGPLHEYRRTAWLSIVDSDTESGQNGRPRGGRTQGNPGAPGHQVARSCGASRHREGLRFNLEIAERL